MTAPVELPVTERLAQGRTAEVFAVDAERVVKVDRPGYEGLSTYEAGVLEQVVAAGAPAPRPHGTAVVDGRPGLVMQRLDGPRLTDLIVRGADTDELASRFVDLHLSVNGLSGAGFDDLSARLRAEVGRADLDADLRDDLCRRIDAATGPVGLCHFDLHPDNVIVTDEGWVVIDWLTVASGPPVADFARTLLLWSNVTRREVAAFMEAVRTEGIARRAVDPDELDTWIRIAAAARLSEGFDGTYARQLRRIAEGG